MLITGGFLADDVNRTQDGKVDISGAGWVNVSRPFPPSQLVFTFEPEPADYGQLFELGVWATHPTGDREFLFGSEFQAGRLLNMGVTEFAYPTGQDVGEFWIHLSLNDQPPNPLASFRLHVR